MTPMNFNPCRRMAQNNAGFPFTLKKCQCTADGCTPVEGTPKKKECGCRTVKSDCHRHCTCNCNKEKEDKDVNDQVEQGRNSTNNFE
jgi:hypothetical protein